MGVADHLRLTLQVVLIHQDPCVALLLLNQNCSVVKLLFALSLVLSDLSLSGISPLGRPVVSSQAGQTLAGGCVSVGDRRARAL